MTFRIVVTAEEAAIFDGDLRIADVFLAGGLATAGSLTEVSQLNKLAGLSDDDLREQAVGALAGDYCPPHLLAQRDAVRAANAVRDYSDAALEMRRQHDAARWEWARAVAPTLVVERA